ncbi:MAG: hypothetical protein NTZ69_15925 [Bacteroidia bacterium]|nr:hypothetical protein [Bacteroidia bacterium]
MMNSQIIEIAINAILAIAAIIGFAIVITAAVSIWLLHETHHTNED